MRHFLKSALLGAVAVSAIPVMAEASWTRSYVIEWLEPAMYYGASSGIVEPGTDCPKGTNPEPNWIDMLVNSGQYTREEAEWIRNAENPERSAVSGNPKMGLRGANRANVYREPTTYKDPGMYTVEGSIGEGINLDGDESTGFTSPTGVRGIDNQFYRALGCWKTYRAPPRLSSGAGTNNDPMREGSWTMVLVIQGEGDDPMNEPNAKVGFYMSGDPMIKTGDGAIARDYTFTIRPHPQWEGILPARVVNGQISSREPVDIMIRDSGNVRTGLELLRSQVSLTMNPDGSLKGYLGGYRPWAPVYYGWGGFGQVNEVLTWIDLPAAWYSMERHADFSPTPGGAKTHISFAMRVEALPAYVMLPDASTVVAEVRSFKAEAAATPATPAIRPAAAPAARPVAATPGPTAAASTARQTN